MLKTKSVFKIDWVILVILSLAGILRCWGINFGLPQTMSHPGETTIVEIALRFGTGDFNPHFLHHPTFYLFILFVFSFFIFYFFCGVNYATGRKK